jgi:hypothetical protein
MILDREVVIGGVNIFLPSGQEEASTFVAYVAWIQQEETIKGEKEQILMFVSIEEEDPSIGLPNVFIQETK